MDCRLQVVWGLLQFGPMRILTRYIVFDLVAIFLLTLTAMTGIVFFVLVGKEAVEKGLGLVPLLRLLPYMLPQAMQFAVPGTMLLATTTIYGRISSSNEVVALKSLGINPMVMVWPTLVLATLVSFATVWINDMAVSWGHNGVQKVFFGSLEEIVYGRLRTTRTYSNDQLKVTVRRVQEKRLLQPTFLFFANDDDPAWTLTADEAEIRADAANERVLLKLVNAEIDFGGKGAVSHPGVSEFPISLSEFSGQTTTARSPSNYALREIGLQKAEQAREVTELEQEMAADVSSALMTGRTFELADQNWLAKQKQLEYNRVTLQRFYTEPHRRWANGFSCLCFVMIGAPMAMWRKHGEFWGSFFMCFAPILLIYYPMLVGCLDMAKSGTIPAPAVWLGNLVLAGLGVLLMRRIVRF